MRRVTLKFIRFADENINIREEEYSTAYLFFKVEFYEKLRFEKGNEKGAQQVASWFIFVPDERWPLFRSVV